MKFTLYLLLFFAFISVLEASYIRSIRVGTFLNQEDAQNALEKLELYVVQHENLSELQKSSPFKLKYRRSGEYYITLMEPFRQRETLQEVLDTLRLEYKDIYVTKLTELETSKIPEIAPTINIQEKPIVAPVISKPIKVVEPKQKVTIKAKPELITPPIAKPIEIKKLEKTATSTDESFNLWQIFFFALLALLAALSWWSIRLKKENEYYQDKDVIYEEKIKQINLTLENKEKFLAHSSHELRTPMTAILGLTHLVLENDLPKFQREYVQKIQISAEHLVNIVNDILDISKIEAGKLKLEKEEFNINEILDYVLNVVSMQTKRNDVTIKLEVDNDVPSMIIGDSLRLGQVLINLLGNAAKFTMDGEIRLHVKQIANFADTLSLEFIISDTGIGMSEEQIQNAFTSYSQADASTSRKFGGTGLGLSISKQLVEMMHGKIKLSSQRDIGTTFNFSVPFQLKDSNNKRHYRLPSKDFLNKRVLIVDSSRYNTHSLVKAFSYFNYKCHVIPAFEEAVLEYAMHFHIIVIHQKRLSKFAVKKINDLKKNSIGETKVVLLNELHSGFNSEIVKTTKIDAFFKTPFTQQSILGLIMELYLSPNLDINSRKKTMKDKLLGLPVKKVLVVEDNLLNHKVIDGLLANTPIALTFAIDGQEAVDLIQEGKHFDLVLMDINMPRIDGYKATKEIRKHKEYDAMPILALTADVMDEAIEKAFAAGMQGHISKPIIVDIFYKKLFDALSSSNIKIADSTLNDEEAISIHEDLSVSMGLNRCNNDEEFYRSILEDFKSMYLNSALTLEELCRSGEFKEARQKAMDIKDVSLNIGAYNLCESAAAMEYEFEKGPRSNWKELISFYANTLDKLLLDIEKYSKNA